MGLQSPAHEVGSFPTSVSATTFRLKNAEFEAGDYGFVQKWQEILSALPCAQQQPVTASSMLATKDDTAPLLPHAQTSIKTKVTQQSDLRPALLDFAHAVESGETVTLGLSNQIKVATAAPAKSAAVNGLGIRRDAGRVASKAPRPQSTQARRLSEVQGSADRNVFGRTASAESPSSVVIPLTVAIQTPANGCAVVNKPARCRATETEPATDEIGLGSDTNKSVIMESSFDPIAKVGLDYSGSQEPVHRAATPISPGGTMQERVNLEISNIVEPGHSSISRNNADIPIDETFAAAGKNEATSEIIPTPELSAGVRLPKFTSIRSQLSIPHASVNSVSAAAHSVSASTATFPLPCPREEWNAQGSGLPNPPQPSPSFTSNESGRSEKSTDAFVALDERGPDAQWMFAGSHRAEAGFHDPSLGWISVRAQPGSSGIHATVVPATDAAAQVLSTHLAGLNAHMTAQYEHLNTVSLASSDAGPSDRYATGNPAHQGDRDNSQAGAQHGQEHPQSASAVIQPRESSASGQLEQGKIESLPLSSGQILREGHVSVIA